MLEATATSVPFNVGSMTAAFLAVGDEFSFDIFSKNFFDIFGVFLLDAGVVVLADLSSAFLSTIFLFMGVDVANDVSRFLNPNAVGICVRSFLGRRTPDRSSSLDVVFANSSSRRLKVTRFFQ